MQQKDTKLLWTIKELQEKTGLNRHKLAEMCQSGQLETFPRGPYETYRVKASSVKKVFG